MVVHKGEKGGQKYDRAPTKKREGDQMNKKPASTPRNMKMPTDGVFRLPRIQEFDDDGALQERAPRSSLEGIVIEASDDYPIPFLLDVIKDVIAVLETNYDASDWNDVGRLVAVIEAELQRAQLDISKLGECLIRLGMVYQRITMRRSTRDVQRGIKVMKGARAGHQETHGDSKAKEQKWSAMVDAFKSHVCLGVGKTAAYRKVAEQFKCSSRTVQRAVSAGKDDSTN